MLLFAGVKIIVDVAVVAAAGLVIVCGGGRSILLLLTLLLLLVLLVSVLHLAVVGLLFFGRADPVVIDAEGLVVPSLPGCACICVCVIAGSVAIIVFLAANLQALWGE